MTPEATRAVLSLVATAPALRRCGANWESFSPAPENPIGACVASKTIYCMIDAGLMAWANNARTAVVLTEAGRTALEER